MKLKNMWKKNKITFLFTIIMLLIILVAILLIYPLYSTRGNSDYGNRLDGIEEVKIKDSTHSEIESYFKKTDKVKKVKANLRGKLYNIVITANDGIKIDDIVKLTPNIFDYFSKAQIEYYDFQVFITANEEDDEKTVIGYKNKLSEEFVWTNNK